MQKFWQFTDIIYSNKKKEQTQQLNPSSIYLPNQIGCRIIQLEVETLEEQKLNKQIVMELLNQYNKAIQYYSERGSQKYLPFQKKIQNFLSRPSVAEVLKGKIGKFMIKKEKNQEELKKIQQNSHLQAKKPIQSSQNTGKKQQDIILNHLKHQQTKLQERIQRKRAISNQSKRQRATDESFSVPTSKKQLPVENINITAFLSKHKVIEDAFDGQNLIKKFEKIAF